MANWQLATPVAFIIFNRPDTTERVFAEIAKARPPKLFVVGDGARADRPGEAEKVAAARAIIDRVDWDCEVFTRFSDTNLGCKWGPATGINWVFEQVEEAIILEDDCLPHPSFFRYCEELLGRFRHDQRIGMISGDNFQFGYQRNEDSYHFSKFSVIWGWASWRDRWQKSYDIDMKHWPLVRQEKNVADLVGGTAEEEYWTPIFEKTYQGKIDAWDYQWIFACLLQRHLTIFPNVNLISNIGFGPDATHTTRAGIVSNIPVECMQFPLRHPYGVFEYRSLDKRLHKRKNIFSPRRLYHRILSRILRIIMANVRLIMAWSKHRE